MKIAILAALLLAADHAGARGAPPCLGQIEGAATAAAKADWIIEANVRTAMLMGAERELEFIVEDVKIVLDKVPSGPFKTALLPLDPCAHAAVRELATQGARIEGKRMRFYGSRYTRVPLRRIFYVEPVTAVAPQLRPPVVWATRGKPGANPIGDGWHRAHSTDGRFSIDLPGPYVDATKGGTDAPGALLRATDSLGSTFMAVFEPLGPGGEMFRSYDEALLDPNSSKLRYKGRPAVTVRSVQAGGQVLNGTFVRVPGGTFLLAVQASERNEAASLARRERFLSSLALD